MKPSQWPPSGGRDWGVFLFYYAYFSLLLCFSIGLCRSPSSNGTCILVKTSSYSRVMTEAAMLVAYNYILGQLMLPRVGITFDQTMFLHLFSMQLNRIHSEVQSFYLRCANQRSASDNLDLKLRQSRLSFFMPWDYMPCSLRSKGKSSLWQRMKRWDSSREKRLNILIALRAGLQL